VHPLHRGTLDLKQHGTAVRLDVLEGAFSAASVDAGTRQLLRWLAADRYRAVASVLDVGCGYGPLGLWLAAHDGERTVLAVDRDARALTATELGAARNGLAGRVEVRGSLGYDGLGAGERFDLVVSNIPAKVGPAALAHLLLDAHRHLTDRGSAAVVVVDRLVEAVDALLLDDAAVTVLDRRPGRNYTTYEYRFDAVPASSDPRGGFERGAYRRGARSFAVGELRWDAAVSYSIDEFDTVGHGTAAALSALVPSAPTGGGSTVVIAGIGQGHVASGLRAAGLVSPLRLVDHDLLALCTAAEAVGPGDVDLRHRASLTADDVAGASLLVVALPEREPVATTAAILGPVLAALGPAGAAVVLHGRGADVSRVLELVARHGGRLEVGERVKVGHHAAVRGRAAAANRATPPR
jgi:16S rRNA (guanine1207-N2)-methyltransferase